MVTYYVWHGGSNGDGLSWANAKTTIAAGLALATVTGDRVLVASSHTGDQALGSTTLTVPAANLYCEIISVDKGNADTPTPMTTAYLGGNGSTSMTLSVKSTGMSYWYGLRLRSAGGNGNGVYVATSDGHIELDACNLENSGSVANTGFVFGSSVSGAESYARLVNCTLSVGSVNSDIAINGTVEMYGCTLAGSALTTLITSTATVATGAGLYAEGCDFGAAASGAVLYNMTNSMSVGVMLVNCKLPASFVMASGGASKANGEITLFNCASGDTHYHMAHADAMGSTVINTGIYANDGASPDGGATHTTWMIMATTKAAFGSPYVSPWIDKYWDGASAITPYLEILRNDSAAAFLDNEVWADFSAQSNSESTKSGIVNGRPLPLASGTAQASGVGLAGWSGESGTAWSGKLAAAGSITPAEVGDLRARVCVGLANAIVYVDPRIRT